MSVGAERKEEGKDNDVELALPYLCGPERLCAVGVVGECALGIEDAEAPARGRAERVAVEEVRTASERLPKDDGGGEDVHEMYGVKAVPAAVEDADHDAEEDAALYRHAALPDVQQLGEVMPVVVPVKEKHVPQACAEKPCDAAVDADVRDVFFISSAVRLCEEVADTRRKQDGEGDDDAVGADGEVPDVEKILMQGTALLYSAAKSGNSARKMMSSRFTALPSARTAACPMT